MRNQGNMERVIRLVAGAGLVALALFGGNDIAGLLKWGLGIGGAVLISTGIVAYCPAWHILGISTVKGK